MRKPAVFVSSTCYDLRQVRADLQSYLENAGFDPVLSEYPTFPVDPGAANIANCRKAVESRADIFVLIIGNRYGSTNEHGKSVTNLEYLTARAKGIPIYVLAMRSIIDMLPVWKDNPGGNFQKFVDTPSLFEFVSNIRDSGNMWVFPFDLAQDIISTLRTQLAYLFADALALRMRVSGTDSLVPSLRNLSGPELRLVIDKPHAWEYLLFSEALLREIQSSADLRRDWTHKVALGARPIKPLEFLIRYVPGKLSEASSTIKNLKSLGDTALPEAFGPAGQPGNAEQILYVANRIGAVYRASLEWKLDFYRLILNEQLLHLRSITASLLDNSIVEIEETTIRLSKELVEDLSKPPDTPGSVNITLRLTIPDLTELQNELTRLNSLDWTGF